jgi:hypothetical protein
MSRWLNPSDDIVPMAAGEERPRSLPASIGTDA